MTDVPEKLKEEGVEVEDLIPRPVGYHLLVIMPEVEETFGDGTILKTDTVKHQDSIMNMIGQVLDMGPEAYSDTTRFSAGPWCERGDHVMFRANSGTRFKVGDREYRLLNDDTIEAVVTDPRAIARA